MELCRSRTWRRRFRSSPFAGSTPTASSSSRTSSSPSPPWAPASSSATADPVSRARPHRGRDPKTGPLRSPSEIPFTGEILLEAQARGGRTRGGARVLRRAVDAGVVSRRRRRVAQLCRVEDDDGARTRHVAPASRPSRRRGLRRPVVSARLRRRRRAALRHVGGRAGGRGLPGMGPPRGRARDRGHPPAQAPVVLYINGCGHLIEAMAESGADVLSIDWRKLPLGRAPPGSGRAFRGTRPRPPARRA